MRNIDKLKSAAAKAVDNFDPNMFVETRDVLSLLDELEAADKRNAELEDILEAEIKLWMQRYDSANNRREAVEKRIAELEASHNNLREAMAGIHNTIAGGGAYMPMAAILNASKRAYEESAAAAGKGEAS